MMKKTYKNTEEKQSMVDYLELEVVKAKAVKNHFSTLLQDTLEELTGGIAIDSSMFEGLSKSFQRYDFAVYQIEDAVKRLQEAQRAEVITDGQ